MNIKCLTDNKANGQFGADMLMSESLKIDPEELRFIYKLILDGRSDLDIKAEICPCCHKFIRETIPNCPECGGELKDLTMRLDKHQWSYTRCEECGQ